MRFNKDLWAAKAYLSFPPWPCPSCQGGTLRALNKVLSFETIASERARTESADDWEPGWVEERATGFLRCNNCGESVASLTKVTYEQAADPELGVAYTRHHQPVYFLPAIPILRLPENATEEVKAALARAFAMYWSDPSSSGNAIRSALEAMLDQAKIPRGRNDHKNKVRRPLPLHARLELYATKDPTLKQPLMALKWLGNTGSHAVLTHRDVLTAFELLEHIIAELYAKHTKTILRVAKAINANKGPARGKRAPGRTPKPALR